MNKLADKVKKIVPDLDTCVKLFDAGYQPDRGDTVFCWVDNGAEQFLSTWEALEGYGTCPTWPAPTLQELLPKVNLRPDNLSTVQELAEYILKITNGTVWGYLWND